MNFRFSKEVSNAISSLENEFKIPLMNVHTYLLSNQLTGMSMTEFRLIS